MPYQYTSLHFYAYSNKFKEIKACLANGAPLALSQDINQLTAINHLQIIEPILNPDPFSIAMLYNYQKCIGVFFESTKTGLAKNIYSLSFLDQSILIKINFQGHSKLYKFYNAIFRKIESEEFPKLIEESKLPKFAYSKSLAPKFLEFFPEERNKTKSSMKKNEIQSKTAPIVLYTSTIPMNYKHGSKNSVDFLNSLLKCSNKEIFRTKFIQSLLNAKWQKLKRFHYIQAILYSVLILALFAYSTLLYFT